MLSRLTLKPVVRPLLTPAPTAWSSTEQTLGLPPRPRCIARLYDPHAWTSPSHPGTNARRALQDRRRPYHPPHPRWRSEVRPSPTRAAVHLATAGPPARQRTEASPRPVAQVDAFGHRDLRSSACPPKHRKWRARRCTAASLPSPCGSSSYPCIVLAQIGLAVRLRGARSRASAGAGRIGAVDLAEI